jgi:hypothetical protein
MKAGLPLAYHHDLTPSFFEQQWQIYPKKRRETHPSEQQCDTRSGSILRQV